MHERRNLVLTILFGTAVVHGLFAWLVAPDMFAGLWPSVFFHKMFSLAAVLLLGACLFYVLRIEDKLGDDLASVTMGRYYERDGLCLAPMIRVREIDGRPMAEIGVYYQSRFSAPVEAVVHLRPEPETCFSHRGARDLHMAFRVEPGGFGVIHQPVAVFEDAQGNPVRFKFAAAVRWPRSHGERLRSHTGEPIGTFDVDWALAYRLSRHEMCGEIELRDPVEITLVMPQHVETDCFGEKFWHEPFSWYEVSERELRFATKKPAGSGARAESGSGSHPATASSTQDTVDVGPIAG